MSKGQEDILLSLVQGVKGKAWAIDHEGWEKNYDGSVCLWEGIQCGSDKTTVNGINLAGRAVTGTLPTELGLLTTLRVLSMPQNIIHGNIPAEIAALPHLESIDLSQNTLTGSIPSFTSPILRSVDLSYNMLSGNLVSNVGETQKKLTDFSVLSNELTGPIPESFADIDSLDTLTLSENKLSGTIPPKLGMARTLRFLYLDNNSFMGSIPSGLARVDSPLAELWLQENLLSGTIPVSISDLDSLFNFYIDGNKFTGTIPSELCRADLNADFFEDVTDDSFRDYCDSVGCSEGHVSLEGVYPCKECDDKFFNPYLGRVGECINLDQRDIVQIIYDKMGGEQWTGLSVEWKSESNTYCDFSGIKCDSKENIIAIDLKGLNVRGQIPEEIGFLRYLESLDLSDNHLIGYLPSDLRWAPLHKLDISGNNIAGIVPPSLCLKGNINDNGDDGQFSCDQIACPVGTFSQTGLGTVDNIGSKCMPCIGAIFIGSKHCPVFTGDITRKSRNSVILSIGSCMLLVGLVATLIKKRMMKNKGERVSQQENDGSLDLSQYGDDIDDSLDFD